MTRDTFVTEALILAQPNWAGLMAVMRRMGPEEDPPEIPPGDLPEPEPPDPSPPDQAQGLDLLLMTLRTASSHVI